MISADGIKSALLTIGYLAGLIRWLGRFESTHLCLETPQYDAVGEFSPVLIP